MAIFETASVVGAISGNLGGVCFANTKGSKVVKKKRIATKSRSNALSRNRGHFATIQRSWREITNDQRNAWSTYAKGKPFSNRLGTSSTLSGYQMFLKIQLNLIDELGFFSNDPPVVADQSIQGPLEISSSVSGGQILHLPAFPIVQFTHVRIKGILLWTDSLPKFAKGYRQIELISFFSGGAPVDVNFRLSWESVFSPPQLNQICAFQTSYASLDHTEWGQFTQIVRTTA